MTTALLLLGCELGPRLFYAQPMGNGLTLAHENWQRRYWKPVNAQDIRDRDWSAEELAGRVKVAVVGDSFAAGAGIERAGDRFSDRLGVLLGPDCAVFTVAKPGWQTNDELAGLSSYPHLPDLVVLAYYLNDIQHAAERMGRQRPDKVEPPPWPLRQMVESSHLANWIYYSLRRSVVQAGRDDYLAYLVDAHADPAVWGEHRREHAAFHAWTSERELPLVVVVFPSLRDPAGTAALTAHAAESWRELGCEVLDLGPILRDTPSDQLVVSPADGHPNEAVHAKVARLLEPRVAALLARARH